MNNTIRYLLLTLTLVQFSLHGFAAVDEETIEAMPKPVIADGATLRMLPQGELKGGIGEQGAYVWRGIPYAEAPIGNLRWRAPRPASSWKGTRDATAYHSRCPQMPAFYSGKDFKNAMLGNEDCLFLNISAPPSSSKPQGLLPVVIWIHGGGNVWGHAADHRGEIFATNQNIVFVSFNYRLGTLGWFAHDAIAASAKTEYDKSPNFAHLDQIAAIKWVKQNIEVFGGDPDNITVAGGSAGGLDVITMIATPQTDGLFNKAIVMSGVVNSIQLEHAKNGGAKVFGFPEPGATQKVDGILKSLGNKKAQSDYSNEELEKLLRNIPTRDLMAALYSTTGNGINLAPISDGIVLTEKDLFSALRKSEKIKDFALISGTTREEAKFFMYQNPQFIDCSDDGLCRPKNDRLYNLNGEYGSAIWRAYSVNSLLEIFNENARWSYRFDWNEEGRTKQTDFSTLLGASHAVDSVFFMTEYEFEGIFEGFPIFPTWSIPGRDILADEMQSYISEFAHSGQPSSGRDETLKYWESSLEKTMVFDSINDGGSRMASEQAAIKDVLVRLTHDWRFDNKAEKCELLNNLNRAYPKHSDHGTLELFAIAKSVGLDC